MTIPLAESFYSIQGEGYNSGKAAYFIRLGGCNVRCPWCDAKETWNRDRFPLVDIDRIVKEVVESGAGNVVITGGEPLIHDLNSLCNQLKRENFNIFLETSGSSPLSGSFDWICLSPKKNRPPLDEIYSVASELKVVIGSSQDFKWAEECAQKVDSVTLLYLQPEWSNRESILPEIVDYVKRDPKWRISMQIHKFMNIP